MRRIALLASFAVPLAFAAPARAEVVSPGQRIPAVARPGDPIEVLLAADPGLQGIYGWLERSEFPFPLTLVSSEYSETAAGGVPGWRLVMTVPASITPGFAYPSLLGADYDDNNQVQYLQSAEHATYDLHVSWDGAAEEDIALEAVLIVQPGMGGDWEIVRPTPLAPVLVLRGSEFEALIDAPQAGGALTAVLRNKWSTHTVDVVRADYGSSDLPVDCASGPGGAMGWTLTLKVPESVPQDLYDLEVSLGGQTHVSPLAVRVLRAFRDPYIVVLAPSPKLLGEGDTGLSYAPGDALRGFEAYDPDFVVVPGDLTRDRDPRQFLYVQKLASLVHRPVFAVPGPNDFFDTTLYAPGEAPVDDQLDALEAGWCRFGSALPYYSWEYGGEVWYALSASEAVEPGQQGWIEERLATDTTVGAHYLAFADCEAGAWLDYVCDPTWLSSQDLDAVATSGSPGGVTSDAAGDVVRIQSQAWETGYAYAVQLSRSGAEIQKEIITTVPAVTGTWSQDNDGLRDHNTYVLDNGGNLDFLRHEVVFDLVGGRYECTGDGSPTIVELQDADDESATRLYVEFDALRDFVTTVTCTRTGDIPHENLLPTADAGGDRTLTDTDHSGFETVVMSGAMSTDEDGSVVAWDWNVDGVAYEGENISAELAIGGHLVTLEVTDDLGAVGETTVTITVVEGEFVYDTPDGECGSCDAGGARGTGTGAALLALAGLALRRRRAPDGDGTIRA